MVRRDAVRIDVAARAGYRKRAQVLVCACLEIQPQDGMVVLIVRPNLAVHIGISRHHHRFLGVIFLQFLGERECLNFFRLPVEFRDPSLIHHGQPRIFIFIEL